MSETIASQASMPREIIVNYATRLRLLVPEDAERLFEIFKTDPEIQERVTWTHGLKTAGDVSRAIVGFQTNKSIRYGIIHNDELAGYVGMWPDHGYMDGESHEGWFGIGYFLDHDYRGNGLVQQATNTMMAVAEANFNVRKWSVYVEDNNISSRAVLEKLGFVATDNTYDEPVMHVEERQWEKITHE